MSGTLTSTTTFNRSHARRVATKMAADLRRMQQIYGWPPEQTITDLIEEVTELLALDYLKTVELGFERDGKRVISLRYEARRDGTLSADDNAGGVHRGVDITGCSHINYVTYTQKFMNLTSEERLAVKQTLPYVRTPADEPSDGNGYWQEDRTYSSNGSGTVRRTYRTLS